jgi:hypothetical protein
MDSHFSEIQDFIKTWILASIVIVFLLMVLFVVRFLKDEKIKKINPWFFLIFLIPIALFVMTFMLRLETWIDRKGISYQFFPLHMKATRIDWGNIDSVYLRDYSPIKEYGGWGIRDGKSGRAYNVSGKTGLQIILKDKERLLIGTKKPEEMKKELQLLSQLGLIHCYYQ